MPSKRVFYSIIADYDVNRSICELVDNAIDEWSRSGRKQPLDVSIELNQDQQTMQIVDNAGGVARDEIHILVGPGYSTNSPEGSTIGYFGVGTKRAVVALAQHISFRTCKPGKQTFLIEYDDSWLESESWSLPVYEVPAIPEGTTAIMLTRLRHSIDDTLVERQREHLAETYALFLGDDKFSLSVNKQGVLGEEFASWAFPPGFEPRKFHGNLNLPRGKTVAVEATIGLANISSPAGGDYGVFWYCNDRLIVRGLKSHHVGFDKGNIGQPHPEISLLRCIVRLRGETQDMPWNSSKSGLNYSHPVFVALRGWLVNAMKEYATISRRLAGSWPETVFKHGEGKVKDVFVDDFPTAKKSYLPSVPARAGGAASIKSINKEIFEERPWTRGLIGGVSALPHLSRGKLADGNRIALIVLDSTLEIAFKEFLVHESGHHYSDQDVLRIFAQRHFVHDEVKKHRTMTKTFWKKVGYYYGLRCKLVHERATVAIPDSEIDDFKELVEGAL
ncbi:MAG: ATP-binding protein, partial [Candidatus Thermoplasmatota archaeon]